MNGDLIDGWLEGDLDAKQVAEFDHLLRTDPGFARRVARRMRLHWSLAVTLRGERPSAILARPESIRRRRPSVSRRLPRAALLAAGMLVAVLGWLLWPSPRPVPSGWSIDGGSALTATRTFTHGSLPDDLELAAGTQGLRLRWQDGKTTVGVAKDSRMRVEAGAAAHLYLTTGRLDLDVGPQQMDAPLVVATPHGTATVLGTRFTVDVEPLSTTVAVSAGRVRVAGTAVEPRILVPGQQVRLYAQPQITGFTWVDSATGKTIAALQSGDRVSLASLPARVTVRAEVAGPVGSVAMRLDGAVVQRNQRGFENNPPFTLFGNGTDGHHPWRVTPGRYRISATPFSDDDGGGTAGAQVEITIEVVAKSNAP